MSGDGAWRSHINIQQLPLVCDEDSGVCCISGDGMPPSSTSDRGGTRTSMLRMPERMLRCMAVKQNNPERVFPDRRLQRVWHRSFVGSILRRSAGCSLSVDLGVRSLFRSSSTFDVASPRTILLPRLDTLRCHRGRRPTSVHERFRSSRLRRYHRGRTHCKLHRGRRPICARVQGTC